MKNKNLTIRLALCLTATICLAEDWPQWRGPRYDAVSRESGLPTEWGDSQNVVWKVQLPGIGSATPVVDITEASVAGTNHLELEVSNTWVNRLAGYQGKPQEQRTTFLSGRGGPPGFGGPGDGGASRLLPAGVLGPVRVITEVKVTFGVGVAMGKTMIAVGTENPKINKLVTTFIRKQGTRLLYKVDSGSYRFTVKSLQP